MQNRDLALKLCSKLLRIQNRYPTVTILIFGSILKSGPYCSDVDILAVSKAEQVPPRLRNEVERLGNIHPIHLIAMSSSEEEQLRFIEMQGAIAVEQMVEQGRAQGHKTMPGQ